MKIRTAKIDDVSNIVSLITHTIDEVNSKDYGESDIAGWKQKYTPEKVEEYVTAWHFLVAEDEGVLVGTGACVENGLWAIFVDASRLHQGIGTAVMEELEEHIGSEYDSVCIASASKTAIPFYEYLGYEKKEAVENSWGMSTYVMEKRLEK